jgi:hypothetical protein
MRLEFGAQSLRLPHERRERRPIHAHAPGAHESDCAALPATHCQITIDLWRLIVLWRCERSQDHRCLAGLGRDDPVLAMVRRFRLTARTVGWWGSCGVIVFGPLAGDAIIGATVAADSIQFNSDLRGRGLLGDFFTPGAKFQFPGNGYVEIQNTKSLQCLSVECHFSLTVVFGPSSPSVTRLIVGQSFSGEDGWHCCGLVDGWCCKLKTAERSFGRI